MPRGKTWQPHEDAALRELLENGLPDDVPGWERIAEQLPKDVAVRTRRAATARPSIV